MPRAKRLTRAEAKARTRELPLDAAAETFARKGYDGASVEEIADSAGYSIGALYFNFGGKSNCSWSSWVHVPPVASPRQRAE
ncbi:TetR family transcriptional regulator [Streptomyces decoyicus]|uniref:TetR family transcriptional regulator n=1 Tax=Streptomyces decoyicus TaxID=249567 RepID=UPI003865D9C6